MAYPPVSIFGFGSEGGPDPDGYYSWGFGDEPPPGFPSGVEALDTGFGDEPFGQDVSPMIVVPLGPLQQLFIECPDDGGVIVVLTHDFAGIGLSTAFQVRLKNSFSNEYYPNELFVQRCLSVDPAEGDEISPLPDGKRLRFCLPPMPPGVYDILVTFGPAFAMSLPTLDKAIRVIRRHHSDEQFQMRQLPAHWYAAGARALALEPPLGGV